MQDERLQYSSQRSRALLGTFSVISVSEICLFDNFWLSLHTVMDWEAFEKHKAFAALSASAATVSPQSQTCNRQPAEADGLLWSRGYNDHILEDKNELDRWFQYLRDNPRRLAIRRAYAEYFRVRFDVTFAGQSYAAIGNRFLLTHPSRIQVRLSRRLTDEEIEQQVSYYLSLAR